MDNWGAFGSTPLGQSLQNNPMGGFWQGLLNFGQNQNQAPAFNDVAASQAAQPTPTSTPQTYQSTPGLLNDPNAFNMMKSNTLPWMKQYMQNPYTGMQGAPGTSTSNQTPGTPAPTGQNTGLLTSNWFSPQVPNFNPPQGTPNDITDSFNQQRTQWEAQLQAMRDQIAAANSGWQQQADLMRQQYLQNTYGFGGSEAGGAAGGSGGVGAGDGGGGY